MGVRFIPDFNGFRPISRFGLIWACCFRPAQTPAPEKRKRRSPEEYRAFLQAKFDAGTSTAAERTRLAKFERDSATKKPKTPLQRVPSKQNLTTPSLSPKGEQGPRFRAEDYVNIVTELKTKSTREAILGSRKKTEVGKKVTSKETAFTGLAGRISALYNARMRPFHAKEGTPFVKMELTGRQMAQRCVVIFTDGRLG